MSENNFNESSNNEEIDIAKNKEQLEYGIKLIIDAYENKGAIYENDIKILLEENEQKDLKIKELLSYVEEITKERDYFKNKYNKLNEEHKKIANKKIKNKDFHIKINNESDESIEKNVTENLRTRINLNTEINKKQKNDLKHSRNTSKNKYN